MRLRPLLLLALLLPACGSGDDLQEPEPRPVAQVVVTAPATTIAPAASVQLTATARDEEGAVLDDRTFQWATSNASAATVSESGLVTGLAPGEAVISATAEGVTGSLTIAVSLEASPPPPPPSGSGVPVLEEVASGLDFPLYLTSPPDDDRLFVAEKGGVIRVLQGGAPLADPFLDLSGQVAGRAEQGLLGLAFPPDYATTGRFVVHYTDLAGDTRVSFFSLSDDPNRADPASETPILAVEQPGPAHNGGQVAFGPDGMLYVGLGDGGSRGGDDKGRAQDLGDLLGAVLRIDVSSGAGYAVPEDNPFVGTAGARPEIWSYGLRNPWRFSFDRETGDLYLTDVGESRWEEVNRGAASDGRGRGVNYGWSLMEGPDCVVDGCDRSGLTLPLVQYDHDEGCSVTGGYVYRGAALPELQGHYLYADFCQGWVRSFDTGGPSVEPVDWPALSPGDNITSFGEDAAGELYVLTAGGSVFKIVSD